jgi:hypothetical protein
MKSRLFRGVPVFVGMRFTMLTLVVALTSLFATSECQAQKRGQKSDQGKRAAHTQQPTQPAAPSTAASAAQPRFKDLAINSTFFFLSDTNRAYPWVKISATTARNTVNTNVATISAQIPITQ